MADVIRLLPDSIANKIAAGEVVQRPASVVKELLENALDARSSAITLVVKDAGKTLIQVSDNGCGMTETDARMSFERHATSKIRTAEDLFSLRTMGFRGEALASIAAVAQVELKTRRPQDELGTFIKIEGSQVKEHGPVSTSTGTTLAVKNLFYNIPARRNFLKSNPVELRHIFDEFHRVALARPDVGFKLYQNDLETYHLPPSTLHQRIVSLFGDAYRGDMATCKEENDYMKLEGILGRPENAKKSRGEQFLFANGRFIRHPYLHHAIVQAYQHLIQEDTHPFYVLFIDIDPTRIDVNVHPTKTEVKFDDERGMYVMVQASVKKSLNDHQLIPAIDFQQDVNFTTKMQGLMPEEHRVFSRMGQSEAGSPEKNPYPAYSGKSIPSQWQTLYPTPIQSSRSTDDATLGAPTILDESRSTFQLHNRYIVAQIRSGVIIIDQHLAHHRILYEKFLALLRQQFSASQQFLFPLTIDLPPADFSLIMDMEPELKKLGFTIHHFGKHTIVINGIPSDLTLHAGSEKELFEGLIEQFKNNQQELKIDKKENLARALSKRAALKHGVRLSNQEMNSIIDQLFACQSPQYAPGGFPIVRTITLDQLSSYFDKKNN